MQTGSVLNDGGNLLLSESEMRELIGREPSSLKFLRRIVGAQELMRGINKYCLVIEESDVDSAVSISEIQKRLDGVAVERKKSKKANTRDVLSKKPWKFEFFTGGNSKIAIVIPTVTSSRREWSRCLEQE